MHRSLKGSTLALDTALEEAKNKRFQRHKALESKSQFLEKNRVRNYLDRKRQRAAKGVNSQESSLMQAKTRSPVGRRRNSPQTPKQKQSIDYEDEPIVRYI